ncbi:surface layer protein NpdA [Acidovorax sp. SUPP3434]|uniref:surface layer protein NpdA n=1 Tax=Acidovorax sp. SUPP3434 TaxID=2920880 RepID=UPI0023DE4760|nr:surface layer protein NpdA [Acidovorax sp. SUPP3434]GKT00241.1 surface layer protein NpdA [Acidovorax sp. SUPP3434]
MKIKTLSQALAAVLGTFALASASPAAVIVGTGARPSSTQLGATTAVGFKKEEGQPGHALLVPYFTAQNGQMTVLHLMNTDIDNGKVVKVRFRGANNGDSLLSVHVLMSPGDMWTAAVTANADGTAQLTTGDRSCTLPRLATGVPQRFSTDRLDPGWTPDITAAHTREGAIEAIVMADIPQLRVYGADTASNSALFKAIKQVNGIAPCTVDDSAVNAALMSEANSEAVAAGRGLAGPTGRLAATWYIMDVLGSTTFSGPATAIQAVDGAGDSARGNYMLFPPTDAEVVQPERYTSDPLLVSAGLAFRDKDMPGNTSRPTTAPVLTARSNDFPDLSTPVYLPPTATNAATTAADLSRLLTVAGFRNQVVLDASISARTDWVVATPTKRYSVGKDYRQSDPADQRVYSVVPPLRTSLQYFHSGNTEVGQSICSMPGTWELWMADREATFTVRYNANFPIEKNESCGAVSVFTFSDSNVLSSTVNRRRLNGSFREGWAGMTTSDSNGIPVIGASFIKLTNPGVAPGVAGNYGLSFPHIRRLPVK